MSQLTAMNILEKSKAVRDALNSWLTVIAVISAGIFGVVEYVDHKAGVRVERSLGYVERYNGNVYLDSRARLDEVLEEEREALTALLTGEALPSETIPRMYDDYVITMVDKHGIRPVLNRLFGFHEEVVLCANAGLCDASVLQQFFSIEAQELFKGFYPYVCEQRNKWHNPALFVRMEHFYLGNKRDVCAAGQ